MKIGSLSLKNRVFLAPMAGITDLPFRLLLRSFSCAFAFTEMISADGILRKVNKTLKYLDSTEADRPLGVQLFGAVPEILAEAAFYVASLGADLVDINMGCPVKKVIKAGAGAALLKNLNRAQEIMCAVRKAISLPLTIKIRSGWQAYGIVAHKLARMAEDCGVNAVIVHPRTVEQGFGGRADWEIIKKVKETIHIPVIGCGDIKNGNEAVRMLSTTGCDGVMIGRGCLGNPWIMEEAVQLLERGIKRPMPDLKEREAVIIRHLEMEVSYWGEKTGVEHFRKHLLWYTKGLPGGAKFRSRASSWNSKEEILKEIRDFFEKIVYFSGGM